VSLSGVTVIVVSWLVTPCHWVRSYRGFGEWYCLIQDQALLILGLFDAEDQIRRLLYM